MEETKTQSVEQLSSKVDSLVSGIGNLYLNREIIDSQLKQAAQELYNTKQEIIRLKSSTTYVESSQTP